MEWPFRRENSRLRSRILDGGVDFTVVRQFLSKLARDGDHEPAGDDAERAQCKILARRSAAKSQLRFS